MSWLLIYGLVCLIPAIFICIGMPDDSPHIEEVTFLLFVLRVFLVTIVLMFLVGLVLLALVVVLILDRCSADADDPVPI